MIAKDDARFRGPDRMGAAVDQLHTHAAFDPFHALTDSSLAAVQLFACLSKVPTLGHLDGSFKVFDPYAW